MQMKSKLLAGLMTCGVRFGKSEDLLELDGVRRPAFHVRSTDDGCYIARLKGFDMMPGL